MKSKKPLFRLTERAKGELQKEWGVPIFGNQSEIVKKYEELTKKKKFRKIITVGDYCSFELFSDVKILDGKTRREKFEKNIKCSLFCSNPASTIQKEVWPVIERAIEKSENVFVRGEEDLLAIPCILSAENGSAVIYGIRDKGIALIEVSSKVKKDLTNIIRKFS